MKAYATAGAVAPVAAATMLTSVLSWGMSLIFGGLLARAVRRRADLRVDDRAAELSLSDRITDAFVSLNTTGSFPRLMGLCSAVVGFFVPSGGSKWLLQGRYVMQAADALHVHLGWGVMVYNAAEALPNVIDPFWMLPLVGIMGVKARDIVGFSFLQLMVHLPLVLFPLWRWPSP